ncbi:MAG: hypothetical protein R8K46_10985 [Mariprofundaceae bacterium]
MRQRVRMGVFFLVLACILAACIPCALASEEQVPAIEELPLGPPIEVELELKEYQFTPNHFEFDIGKLYKLKIHNSGKVRHEMDAPILAVSVVTIGVEVVDKQGNVIVTFRGRPTGLELLPDQTVYWWFFPYKAQPVPREFICDEPGHLKHGMRGDFIIQ